jgi:hypothetical protein
MSLSNGGIKLVRRVASRVDLPEAILPVFLCPVVLNLAPRSPNQYRRHLHTNEAPQAKRDAKLSTSRPLASVFEPTLTSKLPVQCPGCGALSQIAEKDDPGFYTLNRRSLQDYFQRIPETKSARERDIFKKSVSALDALQDVTEESKGFIGQLSSAFAESSGMSRMDMSVHFINCFIEPQIESFGPPVCDRCHKLKHHQTGISIHHPSVQSIQDTIFESPHKYNHIYHIVDAADFPMSLVQGLHRLLHVTPQRSLNRRSQGGKFYHGRKTEVSFVITRSDLLGPTKDHVDKLMPYLRSVLRDALGRAAQDSRLGNVRCVSAKRQWWTKELKEEIWQRGGGGWMVGKVNVGKSQLFHEVFPKGRMGDWGRHTTTLGAATGLKKGPQSVNDTAENKIEGQERVEPTAAETAIKSADPVVIKAPEEETESPVQDPAQTAGEVSNSYQSESYLAEQGLVDTEDSPSSAQAGDHDPSTETLNTGSLLPPLPIETSYPAMPLVSSLPGTTASPIRVPFGNGKGELIDLPGLSRGDLEKYVQPHYQSSLVMTSRVTPKQCVLKPGQSLLIGGFIRITPTTPRLHVLAYNFTRITEHQTSTEKAIGVQTRSWETNAINISVPGTEEKIASAGKFHLKYDVTKARSGPVTRRDAAGIKVERLPYRVLGTDILIEGVGWIELAAQVRKPYGYLQADGEFDPMAEQEIDPNWPEVEIFTPEGKFVAQRRPMNAWLMIGDKLGEKEAKARPRKAMKGTKKVEKMRSREVRSPHPL